MNSKNFINLKGSPMNKEDFIKNIESHPHWINTKTEALEFARHLNYRLLQEKACYKLLVSLISEKHPEFFDDYIIEKLQDKQNHYDIIYNDHYHETLGDCHTSNNITILK
jgi:hypothetical protein